MSEIQYLPLDVEAMLKARLFSQDACMSCVGLTELCPACQDLRDVRDSENAHQIVDESSDYYYRGYGKNKVAIANAGSVGEFNPMSILRDLPSGHDWTEREGELLEATAQLIDRIHDLETSVTVTRNETICQDCRYTHNKAIACPNCN